MSNLIPVPMTKWELLGVLDDIRDRVNAGDSFEGNVEWTLPIAEEGWPDYPPEVQFLVRGTYRVGNRMGQGGVRMIGQVPPG